MIKTYCNCGNVLSTAESQINTAEPCSSCGIAHTHISAEALPDGAGAADFDARLSVIAGPDRTGEHLLLGGVPEIQIGKLPDKQIRLGGSRVSRFHCKLVRLDFAPSRWSLEDNGSTNGVFINGQQIESQELQDGDIVDIGDYQFQFASTYARDLDAAKAAKSKAVLAAGGFICPCCGKGYSAKAKICPPCGIDLKTGRALVTAKGMEENDLAVRVDTCAKIISWFIPFGLFPIASEAFGTKKPTATWIIFGLTAIISVVYLIGTLNAGNHGNTTLASVVQWNGDRRLLEDKVAAARKHLEDELEKTRKEAQHEQDEMGKMIGTTSLKNRFRNEANVEQLRHRQDLWNQREAQIQTVLDDFDKKVHLPPAEASFHWYQLFTSATLHEPRLIMPFLMHLGGNMLFLLVFGLRVNELVGNRRMALIYPLVAAGSGLAYHLSQTHTMMHASLGASGAIMGLAGMYFIFFPVQKVHTVIWLRAGLLTGWRCAYKVFQMRGFWLLACWIAFNDLLPMWVKFSSDHVAHWAHVGGFLCGVALALLLLLTRQVNARGSDLLSVALGQRAWGLLGKPSDWHGSPAAAMS